MKKLCQILTVSIFGWVCVGAYNAQAWTLARDNANNLTFGDSALQVVFDSAGNFVCVKQSGKTVLVRDPERYTPLDIQEDKRWSTSRHNPCVAKGVTQVDETTVCSHLTWGPWQVDAFVQLYPEQGRLRRWFDIVWNEDAPNKLRALWVACGKFPITNENGGYLIPARFPSLDVAKKAFTNGKRDYAWRSPAVVLADDGLGKSATWIADEMQPYSDGGTHEITQRKDGISLKMVFRCCGHLKKGVTQRFGDIWVSFGNGNRESALLELPQWYACVNHHVPANRPDWLKKLTLYSLHPGGTIGSNCKDWGGFSQATKALDHIHNLGCNGVWLMPLEDQSIYCPRDYYKLQAGIGTPEDYKAFVTKAHQLGMHVWQDCVPHGGCNNFPRAIEHPEWLAYDEAGKSLNYWCFDFNWPSWIDYMAQVAAWYTKTYNIDGFRIDAVCGSHIPNWSEKIPYARASHSQSQGGFAMQRALRKAVKTVNPNGANLAEVNDSVFGNTSDAIYDFSICYNILPEFAQMTPEAGVPLLRRWLHEQQYSELPDLVRMRHIESHDSLRSGLTYGVTAQRALLALISFIPGIPLVYQEMEDGSFDAFREIFEIRNSCEALTLGDVDYLSPKTAAGVFACTRTWKGETVVPLINFTARNVTGQVTCAGKIYDYELPPFGYKVIGYKQPIVKQSTSKVSKTIAGVATFTKPIVCLLDGTPVTNAQVTAITNAQNIVTWQVSSWGGIDPEQAEMVFRFDNAESWFANTAEGTFASPYRVRHPNFNGAVGSIYRLPQGTSVLWDSAFHPFGVAADSANVGVATLGQTWYVNALNVKSVRILERLGTNQTLHVAVKSGTVTWQKGSVPTPATTTGDSRLTLTASGWQFTNDHYQLRLKRNGAIVGYSRKDAAGKWNTILNQAAVYTDVGYGLKTLDGVSHDQRYTQADEVENQIHFTRQGETLVLEFQGALRDKQRFFKMKNPIYFKVTYRLSNAPTFQITQAIQATSEPKNGVGFLAYMASFKDLKNVTLTDTTGFTRYAVCTKPCGRVAETRVSRKNAPISKVTLNLGDTSRFELSNITYSPVAAENVFCDGNNFFITWQDCHPYQFHPWVWYSFTATVQ